MQAVISEVVALFGNLLEPYSFCAFMSLGLLLGTGAAARLLTVVQDVGPMWRRS